MRHRSTRDASSVTRSFDRRVFFLRLSVSAKFPCLCRLLQMMLAWRGLLVFPLLPVEPWVPVQVLPDLDRSNPEPSPAPLPLTDSFEMHLPRFLLQVSPQVESGLFANSDPPQPAVPRRICPIDPQFARHVGPCDSIRRDPVPVCSTHSVDVPTAAVAGRQRRFDQSPVPRAQAGPGVTGS